MTRLLNMIPSFDLPLRPFGDFWLNPLIDSGEFVDWSPAMDMAETDTAYIVTLEAPGIDMQKLDVSYSDGVLTVKGEKIKETSEGECCHCSERFSGTFERIITVPGKVDKDKIDATYRDGILKLSLPKSEEGKPKKIEVH